MTRWTRNGKRRGHGGGWSAGQPNPTPTAPSGWPSAAGSRSSAISCSRRADRQLTRRLPRHRPPARGMAGAGHRDPLRPAGRAGLPGGASSARALDSHPELTAALGAFAARDDSQVVAVMGRRAGPRAGPGPRALRRDRARRDRPRLRDGRGHPHGAGPRRHHAARRQPAHRRRTDRRPSLAGRHGAPRRPAAGAPLRHLAPALPAAAPLPLGAAPRAGRHRAAAARRLRGRRSRPRLPLAAPAGRSAACLRRHLVLPLHRDGGHRRRAARGAGARRRRHLARHLARARRRGPAGPVGGRPVGDAPHRPRPARDRRGGRPRLHARRRRGRRVRASSPAGRSCPS